MSTQAYIAIESGVVEIDGEALVFKKGITLVEEGHAMLDAVPDYFEPVSGKMHYEVTTAAPRPARSQKPKGS